MTPTQVLEALTAGNEGAISGSGDGAFRSNVSPQQLREVWGEATARWGDFTGAGEAVLLHDLPLTFARGDAHLQIAYRGEDIVGLVLRPGAPTGRFGE